MGEAPDYGIGERVDVLLVGNVGGYPHECVFPGEVSWVWERHIDVRSGEQVFRVPRPSLHGPRDNHIGGLNHDYFSFSDAEQLIECVDYSPEDEIDYDGEGDDA